jgi:putative flippase GtrA
MRRHFSPALIRQFLQFAAVGLSGTAVQYLTLYFGHDVSNSLSAQNASGIGYLLGSVVNYVLNYFFTFGSSKSHGEAASKYFTILAVGWCINYALMGSVPQHLIWGERWNHWITQLFSTGIVLIWNFAGSKWWAFRHPSADH